MNELGINSFVKHCLGCHKDIDEMRGRRAQIRPAGKFCAQLASDAQLRAMKFKLGTPPGQRSGVACSFGSGNISSDCVAHALTSWDQ